MYNIGLYWIPRIRGQYLEESGTLLLPVKANDVALRLHALAASLVMTFQCFLYERDGQAVSKTCRLILAAMGLFLLGVLVCKLAVPSFTWSNYLTYASYVQLTTSAIKAFPQAYMNFVRRSTEGFAIGRVMLDFTGGTLSNLQVQLRLKAHPNVPNANLPNLNDFPNPDVPGLM